MCTCCEQHKWRINLENKRTQSLTNSPLIAYEKNQNRPAKAREMPTKTTLETICRQNPDTFDCRALSDPSATDEERTDATIDTIDAIEACTHCPLLKACRRAVQSEIDNGIPPVNILRAGIYWGSDGTPDPTFNGTLSPSSAKRFTDACIDMPPHNSFTTGHNGQLYPRSITFTRANTARKRNGDELNFETFANADVDIPADYYITGWDASWIRWRPVLNMRAIRCLLSNDQQTIDSVVTQVFLDEHPDEEIGNREVASDADVCEVIHEALKMGISLRSVSSRLSMGWSRLEKIVARLGYRTAMKPVAHPAEPHVAPKTPSRTDDPAVHLDFDLPEPDFTDEIEGQYAIF